jgi:hypothetical protein
MTMPDGTVRKACMIDTLATKHSVLGAKSRYHAMDYREFIGLQFRDELKVRGIYEKYKYLWPEDDGVDIAASYGEAESTDAASLPVGMEMVEMEFTAAPYK